MAEVSLSQSEADALIALEKVRVDETVHDFPDLGGKLTLALSSRDRRDAFILDVWRARIDLRKGTFQNRAKLVIPLVRVDLGGPPHTNPDGETIACPHIHLYREGFGDKWATPLPAEFLANGEDAASVLDEFFRFCHIVEPPRIRRGLFT